MKTQNQENKLDLKQKTNPEMLIFAFIYIQTNAKNGSQSGFRSTVSYRFGFNGKEIQSECEKHQLKA
jgi:hypothetical protein